MGKAAHRIAELAQYNNAGTVEFIGLMTKVHSTSSKSTSRSRSSTRSQRSHWHRPSSACRFLIAMGEPLKMCRVTFISGPPIRVSRQRRGPFTTTSA